VPVFWPGVLAIVLLLWAQALIWMPYGMRGVRVVAVIVWLTAIDSIVLLGLFLKATELAMISFLIPQIPLAVLLGRAAVARARRGEIPEWTLHRRASAAVMRLRKPFRSPMRAQLWFEWRRHGLNLPALVLLVVPVELGILFLAGGSMPLMFVILALVAVTPPFLAKTAGAFIGRANTLGRSDGLNVFIAVRPLRSASLVGATLLVTIGSTLLSWVVVILASIIALQLSGTWALFTGQVGRLNHAVGTNRVIATGVILGGWLLLSTWRQLVQSLYVGLTGREWLARASVFGTMLVIFFLVPTATWVIDTPGALGAVWNAIPMTLAILVATKLIASIVVARALWRRQVVSDRAFIAVATAWCSAVFALFGSLVWFFDAPYIPGFELGMLAILAVPFARVAAAPLAFDWNRHR
jgi:hypothetical protein